MTLDEVAKEKGFDDLDHLVRSTLSYSIDSQFLDRTKLNDGSVVYISVMGTVLIITPEKKVFKSHHLNGLTANFPFLMTKKEETIEKIISADPTTLSFDDNASGVEEIGVEIVNDTFPKGKHLDITLNGLKKGKFTSSRVL